MSTILDTFRTDIIGAADKTTARFEEASRAGESHTVVLRSLIAKAGLFVAIDPSGEMHIIKGRRVLERIVANDFTQPVVIGAVYVREPEEAEAMKLVFGDEAPGLRVVQ